MHGWKKGVLLGLFSSLLWEPHAVEAAVGKKANPLSIADYNVQTAVTLEATQQPNGYGYAFQVLTPHRQPSIDLLQLLSKAPGKAAANSAEAGVNRERTALQEQKQIEQERLATLQAARQAASAPVLASRGDLTTTYTPRSTEAPPATDTSSDPTQSASSQSAPTQSAPTPSAPTKTAQNGGAVSSDAPTLMQTSGVSSTQGSRAVTVALRYVGVPYRYGGTTPSGFDCSGFLQYVMKQVGVNLPRTTYQQINAGTPVAKANLRPGDLLFFSCNGQATSHSGMYVGNGKFVHADLERGIAIADLNSDYWSSVYEAAVRVQ